LNPSSGIDKSWRRNASLALVKLHFESSTELQRHDVQGQSNSRTLAVSKYLLEYGNASTAYNDIRQFVERLNQDERSHMLEKLDDFWLQEAFDKVVVKDQQNVGLFRGELPNEG
jgi:N-terminal acetyltransferase B complex non-catalytic subunit